MIEATKPARRIVMRWGMGDLGLVAFSADDQQPFRGYDIAQGREYGDSTADDIDRNVRALLESARETVRKSLQDARTLLDRLAAELLKSETVGSRRVAETARAPTRPAGEAVGVRPLTFSGTSSLFLTERGLNANETHVDYRGLSRRFDRRYFVAAP